MKICAVPHVTAMIHLSVFRLSMFCPSLIHLSVFCACMSHPFNVLPISMPIHEYVLCVFCPFHFPPIHVSSICVLPGFAHPFSAVQVHTLPSRFSTSKVTFNSQDWLSMNLVITIIKLLALEDKSRFFHVFQFGNKLIYVGILTFHLLIFFSHHLQAFFSGQ